MDDYCAVQWDGVLLALISQRIVEVVFSVKHFFLARFCETAGPSPSIFLEKLLSIVKVQFSNHFYMKRTTQMSHMKRFNH